MPSPLLSVHVFCLHIKLDNSLHHLLGMLDKALKKGISSFTVICSLCMRNKSSHAPSRWYWGMDVGDRTEWCYAPRDSRFVHGSGKRLLNILTFFVEMMQAAGERLFHQSLDRSDKENDTKPSKNHSTTDNPCIPLLSPPAYPQR